MKFKIAIISGSFQMNVAFQIWRIWYGRAFNKYVTPLPQQKCVATSPTSNSFPFIIYIHLKQFFQILPTFSFSPISISFVFIRPLPWSLPCFLWMMHYHRWPNFRHATWWPTKNGGPLANICQADQGGLVLNHPSRLLPFQYMDDQPYKVPIEDQWTVGSH